MPYIINTGVPHRFIDEEEPRKLTVCNLIFDPEHIMDGKTTVKYLQNYIKQKDFHPELLKDYFLKLSEEVGELSRAIQKNFKTDSSLSSSGLSQIKYPASVAFEDGR